MSEEENQNNEEEYEEGEEEEDEYDEEVIENDDSEIEEENVVIDGNNNTMKKTLKKTLKKEDVALIKDFDGKVPNDYKLHFINGELQFVYCSTTLNIALHCLLFDHIDQVRIHTLSIFFLLNQQNHKRYQSQLLNIHFLSIT